MQDNDEDIMTVDVQAVEKEEITIDSGAGKCVWPRGGATTKLKNPIKLQAKNGTNIAVKGEKVVKFESGGKACSMKFIVTDVKKPLAAVSSIVDEGNVVVFGPGDWGSYIMNAKTKERIYMRRKKGTFVIDAAVESPKKHKKGMGDMDVDGVKDEPEEVFRRQA